MTDDPKVNVDLTAFAPSRCERKHYIGIKGRSLRGWIHCQCPPAVERQPWGAGHIYVKCMACADEGRETVYYDPPHEPEG